MVFFVICFRELNTRCFCIKCFCQLNICKTMYVTCILFYFQSMVFFMVQNGFPGRKRPFISLRFREIMVRSTTWHLSEGNEENHENSRSGYTLFRLKSETFTSILRVRGFPLAPYCAIKGQRRTMAMISATCYLLSKSLTSLLSKDF
jgi:hypothetical protein